MPDTQLSNLTLQPAAVQPMAGHPMPVQATSLQTNLKTIKFVVLIVLVFLLVACASNNDHYNGTQARTVSSDLVKPFVTREFIPAAISCNTEQATLAEVLLKLTNQTRASARRCGRQKFPAVAPLQLHPVLSLTAKVHADDMATADFFSHTGSDGSKVWDRAKTLGYSYRTIAENIAAGHESAEEVHQGWINSPSHCKNLMNPDVTHFGAACTGNPNAELRRYWGTVLARPRTQPLLQAQAN